MFSTIGAIARNTFTESIRQPIFVVMLGIGVLMLIFNPAVSRYTLDDDNKLLIDLSMSTIYLGGMMLAAFTATGVLAREIDNKTVLTVISKPIGRPAFVIGKYLGVCGALSVAFWVWSLVFLMTVRHKVMSTAADTVDWVVLGAGGGAILIALIISVWGNYFYGWVFTSRFSGVLAICLSAAYLLILLISKEGNFQSITTEFTKDDGQLVQLIIAMALVLEALAVICAVAIACSTRLGQVMTLVICLAMFLVGLSSDYMFGRYTEAYPIVWGLYAIPFNVQYLWLADALTQQHPINATYVGLVTAYSALYGSAAICLAIALFQTRETG